MDLRATDQASGSQSQMARSLSATTTMAVTAAKTTAVVDTVAIAMSLQHILVATTIITHQSLFPMETITTTSQATTTTTLEDMVGITGGNSLQI